MLLSYCDLKFQAQNTTKESAVLKTFVDFPVELQEEDYDLADKNIIFVKNEVWQMYFPGKDATLASS